METDMEITNSGTVEKTGPLFFSLAQELHTSEGLLHFKEQSELLNFFHILSCCKP